MKETRKRADKLQIGDVVKHWSGVYAPIVEIRPATGPKGGARIRVVLAMNDPKVSSVDTFLAYSYVNVRAS